MPAPCAFRIIASSWNPQRKDMSTALHATAFEIEDRAVLLRWARCENGTGWVLLKDLCKALGISARGRPPRNVAIHCKTAKDMGIHVLPSGANFVDRDGVSLILERRPDDVAKRACDVVLKEVFGEERPPSSSDDCTANEGHADEQSSAEDPKLSTRPAGVLSVLDPGSHFAQRIGRIHELTAAYQSAALIKSTSAKDLRLKLQECIDEVALPPGQQHIAEYIDAARILQERAYTDPQIARLAGEFGKDLKLAKAREGARQSGEQQFGECQKRVGLYHRINDAQLIEDVLAAFGRRELHQRVMNGAEDPVAKRKREARYFMLDAEGRGRPRHSASKTARPYV